MVVVLKNENKVGKTKLQHQKSVNKKADVD